MLKDILNMLEKWQVPLIVAVILVLAGIAFVHLSLFTGFPAPSNGLSPNLRPHLHVGLFIVGLAFIATGVSLAVFQGLLKKESKPDSFDRQEVAQREVAKTGKDPEFSKEQGAESIVSKFRKLSQTQKEILLVLYNDSHRPRVPVAELLQAILAVQGPRLLGTADAELYYRLKDLQSKGFIILEKIAKKQSDAVKVISVAQALSDADIIES